MSLHDIYQDYNWQEMKAQIENWQEMAIQQNKAILTASQKNNLNGLLMCRLIDKNREQIETSEIVADTGGDCCQAPEDEDEIDFFHKDVEEEDQGPMPFPTGASPKTGGASLNPGGAPSPKHYRKIKFTDDVDESPSGDPKDHQCEPGMTELGGWIICKHCGANLKKI